MLNSKWQIPVQLVFVSQAMIFNARALLRLLIPAVLLVLALVLRPYIPALGADAQTLLNALPYLLAVVSAALALQFKWLQNKHLERLYLKHPIHQLLIAPQSFTPMYQSNCS